MSDNHLNDSSFTENTDGIGSVDKETPVLTKKQKAVKEVKSIILIVSLVLVFRSVFFEPFRIPSGSMIPTLMIGDFILVNKMSYGFKVPFSDISIFDFNSDPIYLFGKSDPKRGDVVVFKFPNDRSINYIKRVVGLPGDEIEIRNKVVFVNGKPLEMKEIPGKDIMEDMDDKFKGYNLKFFNIKTGEIYRLDATTEEMGNVVIEILKGKYIETLPKSDEEFLEKCMNEVEYFNMRAEDKHSENPDMQQLFSMVE